MVLLEVMAAVFGVSVVYREREAFRARARSGATIESECVALSYVQPVGPANIGLLSKLSGIHASSEVGVRGHIIADDLAKVRRNLAEVLVGEGQGQAEAATLRYDAGKCLSGHGLELVNIKVDWHSEALWSVNTAHDRGFQRPDGTRFRVPDRSPSDGASGDVAPWRPPRPPQIVG